MRTAPRTDRGAVSFVEKAILGGAPPLFHAFLCLLRMFLQPGDSIGAGGGGGAAVFADLLQGGPDQLIRHPLPPEGGVHKGVVDGIDPGLSAGECDLSHQTAPAVQP